MYRAARGPTDADTCWGDGDACWSTHGHIDADSYAYGDSDAHDNHGRDGGNAGCHTRDTSCDSGANAYAYADGGGDSYTNHGRNGDAECRALDTCSDSGAASHSDAKTNADRHRGSAERQCNAFANSTGARLDSNAGADANSERTADADAHGRANAAV